MNTPTPIPLRFCSRAELIEQLTSWSEEAEVVSHQHAALDNLKAAEFHRGLKHGLQAALTLLALTQVTTEIDNLLAESP